jgi:hypothetical protein
MEREIWRWSIGTTCFRGLNIGDTLVIDEFQGAEFFSRCRLVGPEFHTTINHLCKINKCLQQPEARIDEYQLHTIPLYKPADRWKDNNNNNNNNK